MAVNQVELLIKWSPDSSRALTQAESIDRTVVGFLNPFVRPFLFDLSIGFGGSECGQ